MTNNTPDYEDNLAFEPQNTKDDTLTEQWKKGELLQDFYYVKCDWSDEFEIRYVQNPECGDVYEEIISPVPSYDEWFKIKNLASLTECLQEKNIECLHRENKLKELLREFKRQFEEVELCRYDVAEKLIKELAFGYQSRKQYNKLISAARFYFEHKEKIKKLEKEVQDD